MGYSDTKSVQPKDKCVILPHLGYPIWSVNGIMIGRSVGNIQAFPPSIGRQHDLSRLGNVAGGFPGRAKELKRFVAAHKRLLSDEAEFGLEMLGQYEWDLFFIYFSSLDIIQHFLWKYCDEDTLRRIVEDNPTPLKLSAMADAERTDYHTDILPKDQSVLDCIRVACYIHQIPTALDMIKDAHDKGYETTLNLMAVSVVQDKELAGAIDAIVQTPVNAIIVVDSFGAFYSEQVKDLVRTYMQAV